MYVCMYGVLEYDTCVLFTSHELSYIHVNTCFASHFIPFCIWGRGVTFF